MVAHLVRLKLRLVANGLRRSVWQTVGIILGSAYGIGVVALLVAAAVAGGRVDAVLTGQVLVVVGAAVVLAWWVVPVFAFGLDATLDPHRFVLYPIARRTLLTGLALAGLVSVPGAVTLLASLGVTFAWSSAPGAWFAAVLGALLAVALCLVGARATTTVLAPLLDSRRSREVLMVAAAVPILAIGPFFAWIGSTADRTVDDDGVAIEASLPGGLGAVVGQVADVVAWTPLGAPWALPLAVHDGAWGRLAAQLAVALATLAVLWLAWGRALGRALVTTRRQVAASRREGLGWFTRLPASPTGAVAARCATYWTRDPRYAASMALVPLLPVVLVGVVYLTGGSGAVLLFVPAVVAFLLGFGLSNDIGYDYTALGLHIASGVPGRADRWGRIIPVAAVGVPLTVAFCLAAAWASGRWDALPALVGLSGAVLGVGLGVSSVVSARFVYPVPKPGESAFKSAQGNSFATFVMQVGAAVAVGVLCLPVTVVTVLAIILPSLALSGVALVVGVATAAVVLITGVRWGARIYERRQPELLQQVMAFA